MSSVGLIISLLHWSITIGIEEKDGLGEYIGNLCVGRSNISILVG